MEAVKLKLKLLLVFLPPNIVTGVNHNFHCVNDFVSTIRCSVNFTPSDGGSYWLQFTDDDRDFVCMLKNTEEDYYTCSVTIHDEFLDTDLFDVSLCHGQNSTSCERLDEYEPVMNIKPNPPCCLSVHHNSSKHLFTWISTYENYSEFKTMPEKLRYHLLYYRRQDKHNATTRDIYTSKKNFTIDDDQFFPDTDYAAVVRSRPSGEGEWSSWSTEVHWKTAAAETGKKTLFALIVIVPILGLLCYTPFKKWRQRDFIPTPAPYFHSLYSDCQGDFKSWVVTRENASNVMEAEETIRIDALTEETRCPPLVHRQLAEGSAYSNVSGFGLEPALLGLDPALLGLPYAVSTALPASAPGSLKEELDLGFRPGSPAEGDSGCWLSGDMTPERDAPWYCNEYCTLSSFQRSGPVPAELHENPARKSCPVEMLRGGAII